MQRLRRGVRIYALNALFFLETGKWINVTGSGAKEEAWMLLTLNLRERCALASGFAMLTFATCAHAAGFRILYAFTGGTDGGQPLSGVIMDKAHNLYGTTYSGGTGTGGTVYKLAPDGTLSVLHAFIDDGSDNGFEPVGGLISDGAGNLYGTTDLGDNVFELAPDGTETVLYDFSGGDDGEFPLDALTRDRTGNLYGTTIDGGAGGCGVVFKLRWDGRESVLYAFRCGADGAYPESGLLLKTGEFYGTTRGGGHAKVGTIFEVSRRGDETVLHSFTGDDGKYPEYVSRKRGCFPMLKAISTERRNTEVHTVGARPSGLLPIARKSSFIPLAEATARNRLPR